MINLLFLRDSVNMKPIHLLYVLLLFSIVGCGKPSENKFTVTGTVTYQGKPLPLGSVMFVPETRDLQAENAAIDADGRYQLKAAPGKYQVQVQMAARLRNSPAPTGEGAQLNIPVVDWLIPKKYNHFQSSGLEAVVEPKENNTIDFPLE